MIHIFPLIKEHLHFDYYFPFLSFHFFLCVHFTGVCFNRVQLKCSKFHLICRLNNQHLNQEKVLDLFPLQVISGVQNTLREFPESTGIDG